MDVLCSRKRQRKKMFPHLFFGFYNTYTKGDIEIDRGNYIFDAMYTHFYIYIYMYT